MEKSLNILMLGGAKRVSMGRMLMQAARRRGLAPHLYSYELAADVPVACIADVITGRRWSDPELVADLRRVILEYDIDIVLPFVDGALEVCASGALPAWSPTSYNATSFYHKIQSDRLFSDAGIRTPRRHTGDYSGHPLIAKPDCGSASKGIVRITSQRDLDAITDCDAYLIQELITDAREITVDCYVTKDNKVCCAVPRRRVEVAGGEVIRTVTVDRPDITAMSHEILHRLGLTGAVTLQFIENTNTPPLLMEINPRLGGGAVCSVYAGADIPEMIVTEWLGVPVPVCDTPKTGITVTRYFEDVVFDNGKIITYK